MKITFVTKFTEEEKSLQVIQNGFCEKEKNTTIETSEMEIFKDVEVSKFLISVLKRWFHFDVESKNLFIDNRSIFEDISYLEGVIVKDGIFKFTTTTPEEMILEFLTHFKEIEKKEIELKKNYEKTLNYSKFKKKLKNLFIFNLFDLDYITKFRIFFNTTSLLAIYVLQFLIFDNIHISFVVLMVAMAWMIYFLFSGIEDRLKKYDCIFICIDSILLSIIALI